MSYTKRIFLKFSLSPLHITPPGPPEADPRRGILATEMILRRRNRCCRDRLGGRVGGGMGIVKMQRGNRNARQDKRLHDVSDYALTLREIHLEHAIVDYQAVSSGFGRRCTQIGSTWTRDVPWRCLERRFGFQVNFTKARCDRTAQKGIRPLDGLSSARRTVTASYCFPNSSNYVSIFPLKAE